MPARYGMILVERVARLSASRLTAIYLQTVRRSNSSTVTAVIIRGSDSEHEFGGAELLLALLK